MTTPTQSPSLSGSSTSSSGTNLSWTSVPDAVRYDLWVRPFGSSGSGTRIYSGSSRSFSHNFADAGDNNQYGVRGVGSGGSSENGPFSTFINFVINDNSPVAPNLNDINAVTGTGGVGYSIRGTTSGWNYPILTTLSSLPPGFSFSQNTGSNGGGTLNYQRSNISAGTHSITATYTDDDGDTDTDSFTITIVAGDTSPELPSVSNFTATSGLFFSTVLPSASNGNPPLSYSVSNRPAWLNFSSFIRTLSGTPSSAASARTLTYTVTDSDDDTDSETFTITVAEASPSVVPTAPDIPDQTATVGELYSMTLSAGSGGDPPLTYQVLNRPNWLSFNTSTRLLSGTPTVAGIHALTYRVTDNDNDSDDDSFTMTASAQSDSAPSFTNSSETVHCVVGLPLIIDFQEADGGVGTVTYTSTGQPTWLSFNASSRIYTGTPSSTGTHTVTYRATDTNDDSDTIALTFIVNAAESDEQSLFYRTVGTGTDGVVWRANNVSARTSGGAWLIRSATSSLRSSTQVNSTYVQSSPAYVTTFFLWNDGRMSFYLASSSSDSSGGDESGPQLTDDAENNLGLAIRTHGGNEYKWTFDELTSSDSTDPYTFSSSAVNNAGTNNTSSVRNNIAPNLLTVGYAQSILVDRTDDNIDWDNLEITTAANVPSAPTAPTVTSSSARSLTASWTEPDEDGGSDITHYDLRTKRSSGTVWFTFSNSTSPRTINVPKGLTSWDVQVRAVNANGDGVWSDSSQATAQTSTTVNPGSDSLFASSIFTTSTDGILLTGTTNQGPYPNAHDVSGNPAPLVIVNSSLSNYDITQAIDSDYVDSTAYLGTLAFGTPGGLLLYLAGSTGSTGLDDVGPSFKTSNRNNLGLAVRLNTGHEYKWRLDTLFTSDSTEPYTPGPITTANAGSGYTTTLYNRMIAAEYAQVILVDRTEPTIDWGTLSLRSPGLFSTDAVPDVLGIVGLPFSIIIEEPIAGTAPYTYSATNSPAWLSFNTTTRIFSGTPLEAGTYTITYSATDSNSVTDTSSFSLEILQGEEDRASVFYREITTEVDGVVWTHASISAASSDNGAFIVSSTLAPFVAPVEIDPKFLVSSPGYVANLFLRTNGQLQLYLSTIPTESGGGFSAGPQFTDVAENTLGLAIRTARGHVYKWELGILTPSDSTDPYEFSDDSVSSAGDTLTKSLTDTIATSTFFGYSQAVLVDISNPAIDWDELKIIGRTGIVGEPFFYTLPIGSIGFDPFELKAGEARTFIVEYPNENTPLSHFAITEWEEMEAELDYIANDTETNTGDDRTIDLDVTTDDASNTRTIRLQNSHNMDTIFVTALSTRGAVLKEGQRAFVEVRDNDSIERYGEREYIGESQYLSTYDHAHEYGTHVLFLYSEPRLKPKVRFQINDDFDLTYSLSLSDRVKLVRRGESSEYFIEAIEHIIEPGLRHDLLLTLAPSSLFDNVIILDEGPPLGIGILGR